MTASCNLFKVLSLIQLISAFILKAFFFTTSRNEVSFKLQIKLLHFDFVPMIFHHQLAIHNPNYLLVSEPQTKRSHKLWGLKGKAKGTSSVCGIIWHLQTDLKSRSSTQQSPHIPHCSSKLTGTWSSGSSTQSPWWGFCAWEERGTSRQDQSPQPHF